MVENWVDGTLLTPRGYFQVQKPLVSSGVFFDFRMPETFVWIHLSKAAELHGFFRPGIAAAVETMLAQKPLEVSEESPIGRPQGVGWNECPPWN